MGKKGLKRAATWAIHKSAQSRQKSKTVLQQKKNNDTKSTNGIGTKRINSHVKAHKNKP